MTTRLCGDLDEARVVLETDERWIEAFNRRDVDALVALYARDAVLMPPDRPNIVGRAAVRDWLTVLFRENEARQRLVNEEVAAHGDWAWLRGHFQIVITSRATGRTATILGKHLVIWRRLPDGSWRAARDIWNTQRSSNDAARLTVST